MLSENDTGKHRLRHVLWIGGGTDAGKTSVAEAIVERHGLQYYNFDRHERLHIDRMAAEGYYITRKNPYDMTPDELWVNDSPETMARMVIQGWARRAEIALDDLAELPSEPMILAEGPGFFPEVVAPVMSTMQQAIWFVPEDRFKRLIALQRGKPSVRHQTRDPQRATDNIIARDLLVTQHVRAEATKRNLRVIEIDGSQTIEELVTLVEQHFSPFLR